MIKFYTLWLIHIYSTIIDTITCYFLGQPYVFSITNDEWFHDFIQKIWTKIKKGFKVLLWSDILGFNVQFTIYFLTLNQMVVHIWTTNYRTDLVICKENSLGMRIAQVTHVINARWWRSICATIKIKLFLQGINFCSVLFL